MTELDSMIAVLRKLGKVPEEAAKKAAPLLLSKAQADANEGVSPSGEKWEPLKSGGGKAMKNAAAALSVKVLGPIIQLILKGPEVIHNRGTTRLPKRQILPDGAIPDAYAAALQDAATKAFDEALK